MPADIDHAPVTPRSAEPLALGWPPAPVSTKRLAWALARLAVESDPLVYAMMSDDEIDATARRNAFMYEAQANHILHALTVAADVDA